MRTWTCGSPQGCDNGESGRPRHMDQHNTGIPDKIQLARAAEIGAVIFTHDPNLIEIARETNRRGDDHCGVIFVDAPFAIG
jgi:hypothetical protein